MPKTDGVSKDLESIVRSVKALPRHRTNEFRFPRIGFLPKLDRLMEELDDVSEFVSLDAAGRSMVLTIRHR